MIPTLLRRAANCNFEVKRRNYLRLAGSFLMVPVLLAIVLFSSDPVGSTTLARSLGACILVAGVGLRFWALGNIDGNKKRLLVTWGAYSRLRHPLYLGSFLILLAFCVLLEAGSRREWRASSFWLSTCRSFESRSSSSRRSTATAGGVTASDPGRSCPGAGGDRRLRRCARARSCRSGSGGRRGRSVCWR